MPFNLTHTTDLKAAWYLSNRGGGCKNKFFCHLCDCTRHSITLYLVEELCCDRCKQRERVKCFHWSICDEVNVRSMHDELESQLGSYYNRHGQTYEEILSKRPSWRPIICRLSSTLILTTSIMKFHSLTLKNCGSTLWKIAAVHSIYCSGV